MSTPQERRAKYLVSPKVVQDLYESPLANALNEEMVEKYQIADEKNSAYLRITADVILGFRKIAELPYLLQTEVGLSQEAARQLTGELIDAWEPVVLREETETQSKKESVASLADKIAAIRPVEEPKPVPPLTNSAAPITPVEFEVVQPMHTMQTDIDDKKPVHGYGTLSSMNTETPDEETIVKATSFEDLRLKQ